MNHDLRYADAITPEDFSLLLHQLPSIGHSLGCHGIGGYITTLPWAVRMLEEHSNASCTARNRSSARALSSALPPMCLSGCSCTAINRRSRNRSIAD